MFYKNIMVEALEDMKHCVETGNIVFQMPEDEKTIAGIMVALKRQIPLNKEHKAICRSCGEMLKINANYCSNCGQKIDWN